MSNRPAMTRGPDPLAASRLAAVIDSSHDAIVSLDLNAIVTSWNPAAERLFGYTADEMIGASILRIVPTERRGEEAAIIAKIGAGEHVRHYETVRLHKDGTSVHVSLGASAIRNESGAIVGAAKIARDITAQKAAERLGGVLAAIVQSSDDAIISTDLDGNVLSWNPAAERLYGYRAEEMTGKSVARIIPADMPNDQRLILSKIRAGEKIEHYETTRVSRTGRRIDVSVTVSPVRDAAGVLIGASKIARDISPLREAERRKDHFLAVLAHELRNPLAPIRAALSLFGREGVPPAQMARVAAIAERQMVQMTRLLDDLLDVSRLTTGKVELKKESLDLGVMARQAVETARPLMEARRHVLSAEISAEPLPMHADPVRIAQILNNLLANAAKYTDPGGKIEIVVRREGPMSVVEVGDNGIGFSEDFQRACSRSSPRTRPRPRGRRGGSASGSPSCASSSSAMAARFRAPVRAPAAEAASRCGCRSRLRGNDAGLAALPRGDGVSQSRDEEDQRRGIERPAPRARGEFQSAAPASKKPASIARVPRPAASGAA